MATKKLLGELINDEVRRQQISIPDFAEMIHCTRGNVYKIFEKSSIQVDQLATIAKVLNRNFFEELARDPSLVDIDSEAAIQEMENRRAVSQFMEVVPNLLYKMGKQPVIAFGRPLGIEADIDLPDFMLTEYGIIFTKGTFMSEKCASNPCFEFKAYEGKDGVKVYTMYNISAKTCMIDVKLDYKTEEEWEKTLRFIFETFFSHG